MIKQTQDEIVEWSHRNFGLVPNEQIPFRVSSFLGMVEELGELAHAMLKCGQGIRGTEEEHKEAVKDSIADLLIFTLDFCGRNGMDAQQLLEDVCDRQETADVVKPSR